MANIIEGDGNDVVPRKLFPAYQGPVIQFEPENPKRYGQILADGETGRIVAPADIITQSDPEEDIDITPLSVAMSEIRNPRSRIVRRVLPVMRIIERECAGEKREVIEPREYRMGLLIACLGELKYTIRQIAEKADLANLTIDSIAELLMIPLERVREILDNPGDFRYPRDEILKLLAKERGITTLRMTTQQQKARR